ncbi:MAG: nucleotidyltransferase family protein [Spirulina sp. SIO3F2]|nr:nucleotidyltransferase family protein [Spirulina sp. SIO3F2]
MKLDPDLKEFIELLNKHEVRYLIVGGYAVAIHGHPRYTKDIDIWIDRVPDNAQRIIQVLKDFGFGALGLKAEDFLEIEQIIQLGYPPNRIDILTSPDGVEFDVCYPIRLESEVDGITIKFIDLENLKKNKQASGRSQDLADLDNLGVSGVND